VLAIERGRHGRGASIAAHTVMLREGVTRHTLPNQPQPLIIGVAVLPSFCIHALTLVNTSVLPTGVNSR
jgi:hypothetical protein